MTALPRYKCHKEVNAVKIAAIEFREDGSATIAPIEDKVNTIYTSSGYRERFKGSENDLGYYVIYDDGYTSWSPSKAFEEGYTQL